MNAIQKVKYWKSFKFFASVVVLRQSPKARKTETNFLVKMKQRRKKSSKELRHEAQQIEIIVTQDTEENEEIIPEIRVLHNTSKNLAFDDGPNEYIMGNDVFTEVCNL